MPNLDNNAFQAIANSFELPAFQTLISEAELEIILANQIDHLLDNKPEYFFNLMYRLDISEERINQAIHTPSGDSTPIAIAKLVILRHKEKMLTRKKYQQDIDDPELEW